LARETKELYSSIKRITNPSLSEQSVLNFGSGDASNPLLLPPEQKDESPDHRMKLQPQLAFSEGGLLDATLADSPKSPLADGSLNVNAPAPVASAVTGMTTPSKAPASAFNLPEVVKPRNSSNSSNSGIDSVSDIVDFLPEESAAAHDSTRDADAFGRMATGGGSNTSGTGT
jgi:hypothetical protein